MSRFCIILVRPRDPNNMGACARAMGNFGLTDLRIVDPYPPIWQESVSAALKKREIKQEIVPLPSLNNRLEDINGLTALVFGNEKTGLSNEDIARCQAVLNIPTSAKQPSINLAQAVILTCYELSRRVDFKPIRSAPIKKVLPTDDQKELLVNALDKICEQLHLRTDLTPTQRKAFLRSTLKESCFSKEHFFYVKKVEEKISKQLD